MSDIERLRIVQAVQEFVNAQSLEERKNIVAGQHRLLFSSTADQVFEEFLSQYADNENITAVLQDQRDLLLRCKREGIEPVFADLMRTIRFHHVLSELEHLTQPADVPRRIKVYETALTLVDRDTQPLPWGDIQVKLAMHLYNTSANQPDNMEQAIEHLHLAQQVFPHARFPQQWVAIHNQLGLAYQERRSGRQDANIERALRHFCLAERVARDAVPGYWARIQNNLGMVYRHRLCGERAENLERSIEHYQLALQATPREVSCEQWAQMHSNLGVSSIDRIAGERADNVEQAIAHYSQALEVFDAQSFPEQWAMAMNNLGQAYAERVYERHGENLEKAIEHCQQALHVRTIESFPEQWAQTQANLGNLYWLRIKGERAKNLEQALDHHTSALNVYKREIFAEQWAEIHNNVARVFIARMDGVHTENLEQAITYCEDALKILSHESFPLEWARAHETLAEAYAAYEKEQAVHLTHAIEQYRLVRDIYTPHAFPDDFLRVTCNLGDLQFRKRNWREAYTTYQQAIAVDEQLFTGAYTEAGRRAEVSQTTRLYTHAAYCLLQDNHLATALCLLEQGKTRLLAQLLAFHDADLQALPTPWRQDMIATRKKIQDLDAEMRRPLDTPSRRSNAVLGDALRQARSHLQSLVSTIRAKYPDFMPTGLDLSGILSSIPPSGTLVAPLITSQGSAAFVIPHNTSTVSAEHIVWFDSLTAEDVQELIQSSPTTPTPARGWMDAYLAYRQAGSEAAFSVWQETVETSGHQLWDLLMEPIDQKLKALNVAREAPVVLMPQGGLGLLPLHAAWREVDGVRRFFLDEYTVSYAPGCFTLHVSARRLQDERRSQRSLLAIVNPFPAGDKPLPYALSEGKALSALFPPLTSQVLAEHDATRDRILKEAAGYTYVHFACHGTYDLDDVMYSGLLLANHDLWHLYEIISQANLSAARLITLSACETGLTEYRQLPDEYIGLPAAFLSAGAPGMVSTLWAVRDLSTLLLLERFYELHLAGATPAAALRAAQLWLRGETAGSLSARFERERTHLTIMSYEKASDAWQYFTYNFKEEEQPYADPVYWAAFVYTGL
jgi:CHAT domain-containing protein